MIDTGSIKARLSMKLCVGAIPLNYNGSMIRHPIYETKKIE